MQKPPMMVLLLTGLVLAMTAAMATVVSAAKPAPEFTVVEIYAAPLGDDCEIWGRSFTNDAKYVSHRLAVDGVVVGPEVHRVTGEEVAELNAVVEGGEGGTFTVFYDTYIVPSSQSLDWPPTDALDERHVSGEFECVAPETTPYLDGYPTGIKGRTWSAIAVAGEYPKPAELSGVWTVDGVDYSDPGDLDPVGGTVDFRFDDIDRKTPSVTFTLLRKGAPTGDSVEISR